MNRNTFNCIYSLFKENIEAYIANGCFNNFINVNFILKTLTHITLKKDYVLDACEVKEDYYREGGSYYLTIKLDNFKGNIDINAEQEQYKFKLNLYKTKITQ